MLCPAGDLPASFLSILLTFPTVLHVVRVQARGLTGPDVTQGSGNLASGELGSALEQSFHSNAETRAPRPAPPARPRNGAHPDFNP